MKVIAAIVLLIVGELVLVKNITEKLRVIEMKIEGEGFCIDSSGKRHSVAGIGTLPDFDSMQSLKVSGSLNFDKISCDEIKIEGDCQRKINYCKKYFCVWNFQR